jgi:cytochrome b-561
LKPTPVLWYAAILVFKTVDGDKTYQKAVHLTLNGVAVLVALVGVAAAYKFHLDNKFDNFYSLHSWFGITTIIFYLVQVNSLAIMLNDSFNCQF